MTPPDQHPDDDLDDDPVLPTFVVLARFASTAPDAEGAVRDVVRRLREADEPFQEVTLERTDGDTFLVVARFVLVSIDVHTAVGGLTSSLTEAGVVPDEVWADQQLEVW